MKRKAIWLMSVLMILAVISSACQPAQPTAESVEEEGAGQVEVFSWWTAGGEAEGLEAMKEVFAAEYPDIEFINAAVAGGAGTNARAILATRLQANDPPDSWQGHAGQELIGTYVAAGQLQALNDLYDANGWLDVMPESLIPLISQDGNIYSVPVNIHRANVMWYNPAVLDANGIEVPTTWDEFFAAAEALDAAGVTPLAMGEAWTTMHLLETVLLGSMTVDEYNGLWNGGTSWDSAVVTAALNNFSRVLGYTNSDASTLSWDQAAQLVADGDAAFTIMGDWAEGYFKSLDLEPRTGFGWAATPGSDGRFQFLSDSFVLPVSPPNEDAATAWLNVAGSKAGQEAFNPIKGSICARTDCDPTLFDEYLQSAMEDWSTSEVVGSLAHGVVANDNWKSEIDTAIGLFLADGDVSAFQAALSTAAETSGQPIAATPETTSVEIFTWWTAGGEAEGLEAMLEVFTTEHPEYEFVNAAVAGGAGTNARAVLATRLQAGDPPDSWQGHAGQELIGTYVAAGQLQALNDLYDANGWLDVMPESLIPLISQDGNIYSVPVNIHRANVMWYNPAVLDANGIEVPATWDEFFAAADTLDAAGITPLAMGEAWTTMHLLETVLLGSMTVDEYNGLWSGDTAWDSEVVTGALENFDTVLGYTNSDASTLSWDQAAQLVADGDAAFTIMGDWAEGYFKSLDLEPRTGFGWAATPGSDGVFQFLSDSFVLPVGPPNEEGALTWLTVAGSKAGQEAFNPIKGSICARTDCDPTLFDEYLQSAMDDWSTSEVVGSLAHGVVANDNWKSEIDTAIGLYLADGDVEAFQAALTDACASSGPCQ